MIVTAKTLHGFYHCPDTVLRNLHIIINLSSQHKRYMVLSSDFTTGIITGQGTNMVSICWWKYTFLILVTHGSYVIQSYPHMRLVNTEPFLLGYIIYIYI